MKLWGNNNEPQEQIAPEQQAGNDPMMAAVMGMVAKNPMLKEAFSGIERMFTEYNSRSLRLEQMLAEVIQQNNRLELLLLRTHANSVSNLPPTANGEPRGIANDGSRCVYCGSGGECLPDCPSHSDATFRGEQLLVSAGGASGGSGDSGDAQDSGNAVGT